MEIELFPKQDAFSFTIRIDSQATAEALATARP